MTRNVLIAALVLVTPSLALAASDSIFTLGLGSHTAVSRSGGATAANGAATSVGQGFTARLRMVYVLGAELSYDLGGGRNAAEANVQTPTYKLSGLLYLVPSRTFSLFLLGGLGASAAGDLLTTEGATTSYHAGAGLEVGLSRHWVISADFRFNLPAYTQVVERGKREALEKGDMPALTSYYNLESWQLNVGIRFYL